MIKGFKGNFYLATEYLGTLQCGFFVPLDERTSGAAIVGGNRQEVSVGLLAGGLVNLDSTNLVAPCMHAGSGDKAVILRLGRRCAKTCRHTFESDWLGVES
jgi:hypothetical protein